MNYETLSLQIDGRTYVVTSGVHVIDVSDPYRPEWVASLPAGLYVAAFEVGGSAYAADTYGVLGLVPYLPSDNTPPTVARAVYNPDSDTIRMDFSEPVAFPVNSILFHIRDENQNSGGVTLSGSPPVKGSFTTFQLDAAGAADLDMMNSTQLDVDAGAVSDLAGNQIAAIADIPVAIEDPIPPSLVQATYATQTRTLNATFHEPIRGPVAAGLLNVRETGDPSNGAEVPLSETTLDRVEGHSVYFVLDAHQAATLERMDAPQLDVDAGAVFDTFGNPARAVADRDIDIVDDVPPTVLSAVYYQDTGVLRIAFSEPLKNMTQQSLLHVRERGESSGSVTADSASIRGNSAYLSYSTTKQTTIMNTANATLNIGAGAVADRHGQPVAAVQDLPLAIVQFDTTSVSSVGPGRYSGMGAFEIGDGIYLAASAYTNGIQVVDVTDPASPTSAGNTTGLTTGDTSPVAVFAADGRTYAVSTAGSTIHMVNVTDPSSPAPVGSVTTISTVTDVDVFEAGGRVWAAATTYHRSVHASSNSIQLFDVTDPASPAVAGNIARSYHIDDYGYSYPAPAKVRSLDIFKVDGRTYAVSLGHYGMLVADVTDPDEPEALTLAFSSSRGVDVVGSVETFVSGDGRTYALALHGNRGGATVFDVTNPARPALVAEMPSTDDPFLGSPQAASILTVDDRTYALIASNGYASTEEGVLVVDLTYPHDPYYLSDVNYNFGVNNIEVFVADGRAHMALARGAIGGNVIDLRLAGPPGIIVTDYTPFTLSSAAYNTGTGLLNINFSKPLNHTATDYAGLIIAGQQGNVTLDQVATKTAAVSAIWATLDATQMETVGTAATLVISEGAVSDLAGNGIAQTTETIEMRFPLLPLEPVANLTDDGSNTALGGSYSMDGFEADGRTYAVVAGYDDNGIQIVNITDPANPTPLGSLVDDSTTRLVDPLQLKIFEIDGRFYAHVSSFAGFDAYTDDGIQIINITDPDNPVPLGSVAEDTTTLLRDPEKADVFAIGNGMYSIVASFDDRSIQIINITDLNNPVPLSSMTGGSNSMFDRIFGVKAFRIGDSHYAVTLSQTREGIQIINVTKPAEPAVVGSYTAAGLGGYEVDVFHKEGATYAVLIAGDSDRLQIVDITDPAAPVPSGHIIDDTLDSLDSLKVFTQDGRTYALVTAIDWGAPWSRVSLLNITDTTDPVLVASILDDDATVLSGSYQMYIHRADGSTYATIAAYNDDGIQVLQLPIEAPSAQGNALAPHSAFYQPGGQSDLNSGIQPRQPLGYVGGQSDDQRKSRSISGQGGNVHQRDDLNQPGSQGGQVAIAFSGPINGTILPERLHIRNASSFEPAFALSGQPEITNGNTTTFTLDPDRDAILRNMTSPLLDIEEGAVYGMDGNPIPDIRGHPIDIPDITPPILDSATYHTETGQLDITFTEPLNHTATDHTLLELLGPSSNLTLAHIGEPAAVNGTISAHLNATHLEALGGIPSSVSAAQAAVHDTAGNPIQPATIPVDSDTAPEMDSATYHTETGQLDITFTEPLNHTATDHTLLELLGPSSNLTLAHIGEPAAVNGTISAHLNATHLEALGGTPLAVSAEQAAVYDTAGNPIRPATIPVSVLGPDDTPPTVSSATYDMSGRLTVQFSEPINHTSVVHGYLAVLGSSGNLTLADIPASGHTAPANHTIAAALNATHRQAVGEPATLAVSDDALRDVAGNPIQAARHPIMPVNSPPVADAGPDQAVRPGQTATLNGTASYDPDADAISYLWSQEDGPTVSLSNHTSPTPTFTAPDGPAILAFRLNVTDGASSSSDATAVSVTDISGRLLATPINLRANSTVYSVTLAWDYPGNDTITGYKILSRMPATQPNLHTIIHDTGTSATTHTIPNLEPATAYTFRVVAMNDDGQSNPSRFVSISTKDPPPPAIPTNLQATSTASSVTLTWDDPNDPTVTGYKILARERDTQSTLTVLVADTGSADTSYTIPNLEPDTAYVFRIIALGHGESPRSASVAISTTDSPSDPAGISHSGPLSPPTNLQAISTVSSVTLKWDDPNGDTITGYKILSRIPATQPDLHTIIHDTGTPATTHTIPDLEPATAYTFRVVAMSDDGQSQPSHFVSISTKDPPPPAIPTNLRATSTASSVTLTWDDPDDTTVTGYKILSRERDTQNTLTVLVADTGSADTSYTIPNLEPDTAYVFRIIALGHGESPRSASVAISTTSSPSDPAGISPKSPLSPPTNLKATSTTSSVTLKWDDPNDDTITGYKILSRIPATQPDLRTIIHDTGTSATKYTIPNLEPATAYTFRVVALSDDGQSQPSRFVSISTKDPSPPAIPTNLRATSTTSSVTLAWDDPNDPTITGYEILSRERDTQPKLSTLVGDTGTPATTHTIPNLEPGTAYVFRIIALSDYGESKFSDPVTVSTLPDRPPAITLAGQADMAIQVGSTYAEPGYTATDDHDGDITGSVVVTGTVDASTTGTYTIRYDVTDSSGNPAVQQVRTVRVVDETPPVITLSGSASMSILFGTTYAEPGYTATDDHDGDITGSVVVTGTVDASTTGTYTIRYDVTDSSGNPAVQQVRTVRVVDETPPVITLSGSASMSILFGTTYAEPGYTATDNYDGDITGSVSVSGTVDAAVPGTYTIRYDVADSSGNAAETRTRTVTVGPIPISNSTAPVPPTNSTAPVPPTNSTAPVPPTNSTTPNSNSTAVDGQSMTPLGTHGMRGPAPDSIQSGAIRVGWETLDEAPRDYRVSWAKTVEPFLT